jgi:hypothetical protein
MLRNGFLTGIVLTGALAALAAQPAVAAPPPPPDGDPYAGGLAQQEIVPDLEGIVGYLKTLRPSPENRKVIASLIRQLGDDSFARRELAMRQLIALPVVPVEDLRRAADSGGGGELCLRARHVIVARSAGNASSAVAVACFRTITKKKLTGAAPAVLEALPLYAEEFALAAGRDALRATCGAGDADLIRRAARHGAAEARVAAVGALPAALGESSRAELTSLLNDAEARVKLAAARALADQGDRNALATLVELLSAKDVRVRQGSASTLRALTGRQSDFAPWVEPEAQADAIRAWQQWLSRDAGTAQLTYPIRPSNFEFGRTLICLYAKNEVIEVDAAGQQTFAASEAGGCPWAAQGLSSGGRLVAMYSSNTIVEYAADGKERVRIPVPGGPMSVQRLENGNTLVACNNAQKVAEVDESGKVVWEVAQSGGPCDAVRLENGNTLVTLQNSNAVVEVTPGGKEVWRVEGLHTPRSATRLENGNTLVCDLGGGRVIEYDHAGNEAWSQGGFSSPFGAQRLSNGSTLVSDTSAVTEIDREGKVLSEDKQPSLGRVHRY